MNKFLVAVFTFLLCIGMSVNAQEGLLLKNFPADNMLGYKFVGSIVQDGQGFMWFGTQDGLYRFDGIQFVRYQHDNNDSHSLSNDTVSALLIDNNNNLWVGTRDGGLNVFNVTANSFEHLSTQSPTAKLVDDNVNALFLDSVGKVWVGTEHGFSIVTYQDGKFSSQNIAQELGNPRSLSSNTIQSIAQVTANEIWVGTYSGINVFDIDGHYIRRIALHSDDVKDKLINVLYKTKANYIWIGTIENGLIGYDLATGAQTHFLNDPSSNHSIPSNTIEAIHEDSRGQLWIATDKGIALYNDEKLSFMQYKHSSDNTSSLINDFVLTFYEDKDNLLWIGTFAGVNRWNPQMSSFNQYNAQKYPVLRNETIMSFTQQDEDTLYFSSYTGGIYRLSLTQDEIERLPLPVELDSLTLTTLLIDNNLLWVGTRTSGLYQIDLNSYTIKNFKNDSRNDSSISANSITDIAKDHKGNLWVSTYHQGLNKYQADGTFKRYIAKTPNTSNSPSSNHIVQIVVDNQSVMWLATYGGGINRFDPETGVFDHIMHQDDKEDSLSSDLAWYLLNDAQGNLWVGTQAAGLDFISKEKLQALDYSFEHLDIKDGMKSRTVYGIEQDQDGNIWLSSNIGISRYSPDSKIFKHFDMSHGLVDMEYNHAAIYKSLQNKLYFGAGKGFVSLDPNKEFYKRHVPVVHLTNILKMNEPVYLPNELLNLQSMVVDYNVPLISFEYIGLNYIDPQSTRYKYRLVGFDQQWIDAGTSRRATYTNLPAGEYQLQISAGNNDNVWSDPGFILPIVVKPAPWNTWWAYLIYTLAAALLLLAYSRFLNRKLVIEQQQKNYLKQQVKEKTRDFQQKNIELEQVNKKLEAAATIDKTTGVKSRRYLDIYIDQASQLMAQIHQNILPVHRNLLPRLYLALVKINSEQAIGHSELMNLTDLLLYSRNNDDLVIRWSENTFAIIGYEKEDNARELASRLVHRLAEVLPLNVDVSLAYSFYPFDSEQPNLISWDQMSVLTEFSLSLARQQKLSWLGVYAPKERPFEYIKALQSASVTQLAQLVKIKQS